MQPFTGAPEQWNATIAGLPNPHLLQTWQWGDLKRRVGWEPQPYVWVGEDGQVRAAAQVLTRAAGLPGLPARLVAMYVPRGPLLDWRDTALRAQVLADLRRLARRPGVILLKIDPEVVVGWGDEEDAVRPEPVGLAVREELRAAGWRFSPSQVQFRNTVLVDLSGSEDDLLARMKQKTRYNIRLAQKKGVTVRQGTLEELPLLYQMYAETSVRDGFVIRGADYYLDIWRRFMAEGLAQPLIAEVEGEAVAAIVLFHFAGRAWYLYGMSRAAHREKMPNALLQWEAMRRARAAGCTVYDLWGAPDVFTPDDPMWGVYRFKEGLGGQACRTLGAWDIPGSPLLYTLFSRVLPRLLDVLRRRGKARTQREVESL